MIMSYYERHAWKACNWRNRRNETIYHIICY